ncbi:glycosyltransferase family 2 protein [Methanosarcina mazei]|uniref:Dolichyl-phosphate mannose synthase n=1 Tax=Methanosarcina mazei TaxID=2209 RepID=A0A0F8LWZ1_METMZ|nr:glycosyltransferase family 2 protein [Methanosarcina mazei]KKH16925.1 dolichyl-phosphate mannose synthase [Methanosarcina mazei]KKH18730.1 dolichyl-phosphate mannose synthase [Methanosarcina mazei]KKH20815.1 dolichyl-phosphate mannose synthase [Methanosarcina mazei]
MNIEVHMSKSTQIIQEEQGDPGIRSATPQNITVVLPAFNEEVSIGSIVLLTKHYADNVIVVDDGSSDRTASIARKAGAHVIVHEVNKGKGAALKTGFKAAAELGADIIVTMDSDGQHNPAEIPLLAAPIIDGYAEMVNGSRYLNHKDKNTPIYRRIGQTVLDTATNMNSGLKITDSQSGFRAFAGSTKDVFRFNARGMAIESEMLADAGRSGLRITEVEIGVRYDVDCSTISPIKHGLGVLLMVLKDIEFNRPLYYLTAPGLALGVGGLYMGANFLQIFFTGGSLYFGPTMLMILFIIVGTFMALTGIMLHSVSAVLRETKTA